MVHDYVSLLDDTPFITVLGWKVHSYEVFPRKARRSLIRFDPLYRKPRTVFTFVCSVLEIIFILKSPLNRRPPRCPSGPYAFEAHLGMYFMVLNGV